MVLDFDVDMLFSRNEMNLDSLTEQPLESSLFLSAELLNVLEEAREKVEENIGIHNLSNEQLIEYMVRRCEL